MVKSTSYKRSKKGGAAKTMKNNDMKMLECCNATYHGLHHWHKSMFEELGWMILAKSHGLTDKITAYKNSLQRLKWSIEHKMTHTKERDRKEDLMILHGNLMVLIEHADKDL